MISDSSLSVATFWRLATGLLPFEHHEFGQISLSALKKPLEFESRQSFLCALHRGKLVLGERFLVLTLPSIDGIAC